ncbi:TetR family transcriptional regulator [Cellulomonas endophytica]|uniref:TetR family transcriptional regulator n=1 Tax=Cellulomonas endophytica TaxID=2494735 RepID=UPI001012EB62|nr:TetR family transcriptional regulator [Cellulomonas endophytica]
MTGSTRDLVRDTALRLFREHGYERTTMRRVATEAGVATGIAYYYFPSKGHLVHELYREVVEDHHARAVPLLGDGDDGDDGDDGGDRADRGDLAARLGAVLHAGLDAFAPYHGFGAEFVTVALRPGSGASPFSEASGQARERALDLLRRTVDGARPAVPRRLRADLPELLWLAELGVLLHWVHDASPGQARTRALVDRAVPLLARLVGLARLPVLRGPVDDLLALVAAARP